MKIDYGKMNRADVAELLENYASLARMLSDVIQERRIDPVLWGVCRAYAEDHGGIEFSNRPMDDMHEVWAMLRLLARRIRGE